ncbi:acyltransferase [Taibaiella soli]|uniref:Acyltransferase n=1 Tax=Taibaiella soli TaxID=1649169 RepID=A0A2W2AV71_9BACT|nr:acyltransferase [Taibaiella soli]PZF71844.1 acyltransferase [Taibaiella soli]
MSKGPSHLVRKIFGLRPEMSISFYMTDFLFRKILRQNAGVTWAIHHTSTIHSPEKLKRGTGCFPGDSPGVYIDANNGVSVGAYTNLGPNVGLISSNHDFVDNDVITPAAPIQIGNFCWFGKGATVLPGVTLGDFTIIGAGAIVTKSFPEGYCVIAGNPARVIKQLNKTECDAYAASKTT